MSSSTISDAEDTDPAHQHGWSTFHDDFGNPYHYNFLTGQSVWALPTHPQPQEDHSDQGYNGETDSWTSKAALAMIRNQNEYSQHEKLMKYIEQQRLKDNRRGQRMQRRRRREQRRKFRELFSHTHTSESKLCYRMPYQSGSFDDTSNVSLDISALSDEYDEEFLDNEELIDFKTLTTALSLWKDYLKRNYYDAWLLKVPETIATMSSLLASAKIAVQELSDWSVRHLIPRPNCDDNVELGSNANDEID